MKINTFNIETTDWSNVLIIGFYNGEKYFEFNSVENFVKYLLIEIKDIKYKKEKFVIYAHNGGKFDFIFILDYFFKNDYKNLVKNLMLNQGKIFSFSFKNIVFKDSYLLFYCSLDKITRGFNVKHKKFLVDYNDLRNEDYKSYCYNNCVGLYECIKEYESLFDIEGKIPLTLTSLALKTFLNNYRKIKSLSQDKNLFVRNAYFGGRVEVYKKQEKKEIFVYDCNALYAFIMQNNDFPVSKGEWIFCKKYKDISRFLGFVECEIEVYKNNITLIPVRSDTGIIYGYGVMKGVFSTVLLNKLLKEKLGRIISIKKCLIFLDKEKIFYRFISTYWNLRKNATSRGVNYMYKRFMNSLYGKFAEKPEGDKFVIAPTAKDIIKKNMEQYSELLDLFSYKARRFVSCENVAISALVTDYARIYIFDMLQKYKDNLYYTDTDSLHLNKKLIKISNKLGGFKLEKTISDVLYLQPKAYLYKEKGKNKACVKGFEHFTIGKKIKLRRFSTFKRMIKNGLGSYIIEKELKTTYNKRKLLKNEYKVKKIKFLLDKVKY